MAFDFAKAVIDGEMGMMLKRLKRGLDFSEKNLALDVIAILALNGQQNAEGAEKACRAGADLLGAEAASAMPGIEDWCDTLDKALPALDQLRPADKGKLVNALIATTMADNKVAVEEMELLRVICLVIHVPLPMITGGEAS